MKTKTSRWIIAPLIPLLFIQCTDTVSNSRQSDDRFLNHPISIEGPTRVIIPILLAGSAAMFQKIRSNKNEKNNLTQQDTLVLDSLIVQPTVLPIENKENSSIAELLLQLAPPKQSFTIDNSRDTMLACESGTVIYFPADIFETDSLKVDVTVEEFYDMTEYISANLSTISRRRLLESGGTVNINATVN